MRAIMALALSLSIIAICATARTAAVDAVIRGVVTDAGGKPIAGTLVKATRESKSISRYTGADGRYELTVSPGEYAVVAEAFGFGVERRSVNTSGGWRGELFADPELERDAVHGCRHRSADPGSPAGSAPQVNLHQLSCPGRDAAPARVHRRSVANLRREADAAAHRPRSVQRQRRGMEGDHGRARTVVRAQGAVLRTGCRAAEARSGAAREDGRPRWRGPRSTNTRCRTLAACLTA